jgi:hypothetical protein
MQPIGNLCRDADFVRRMRRYREAFESVSVKKGGFKKAITVSLGRRSGLPKPQPGAAFTAYGWEHCPHCLASESSLLAFAAAHPQQTVKYYMLAHASNEPRNAISSYNATSKSDARAALSGIGGFNPDKHATFPIVFRRGTAQTREVAGQLLHRRGFGPVFIGGNDALQRILQKEA